jgi:hypothetical protein
MKYFLLNIMLVGFVYISKAQQMTLNIKGLELKNKVTAHWRIIKSIKMSGTIFLDLDKKSIVVNDNKKTTYNIIENSTPDFTDYFTYVAFDKYNKKVNIRINFNYNGGNVLIFYPNKIINYSMTHPFMW